MKLTPAEIAIELEAIEVMVPAILEDRGDFPRLFEELTWKLLGRVASHDHDAVLKALEAIVERSRFNG